MSDEQPDIYADWRGHKSQLGPTGPVFMIPRGYVCRLVGDTLYLEKLAERALARAPAATPEAEV